MDSRYLPWPPGCKEYFNSFADGRFDRASQLWFILPRTDARIDVQRGAFVVGNSGADGIEFCFRRGHAGIWAFYPIEEEWVFKADTLEELESGWLGGSISV